MIAIGADFHPEFQQIALVDTDTGEFQEKRLAHGEGAETFYRALAGQKVHVGMEAGGHARWFERLLAELQFEVWIGDAAEIQIYETKHLHCGSGRFVVRMDIGLHELAPNRLFRETRIHARCYPLRSRTSFCARGGATCGT
jgi:hypothetical protein